MSFVYEEDRVAYELYAQRRHAFYLEIAGFTPEDEFVEGELSEQRDGQLLARMVLDLWPAPSTDKAEVGFSAGVIATGTVYQMYFDEDSGWVRVRCTNFRDHYPGSRMAQYFINPVKKYAIYGQAIDSNDSIEAATRFFLSGGHPQTMVEVGLADKKLEKAEDQEVTELVVEFDAFFERLL